MARTHVISKYAFLLTQFFKASLVADLEYRLNFVVRIFTDILWYVAQVFLFEVLFRQSSTLGVWSLEQTRVFLGVLFLVDSVYMIFFSENLDHFSDKIRKGEFDLLLTKPVNSQFMMSFQKMAPAYLANFTMSISWLTFALYKLPQSIELWNLLWIAVIVPGGVAIVYSLRFIFSCSAFVLTRAENIGYLWYQIYKLGTRPDAIYPKYIRYMILTLLPVGFVASQPTHILFGNYDPATVAGAVCLPVVAAYLSRRFYLYALRQYASASS